ncbi:MAG TPA: hypothetical protein VNT20_03980 [Flavisolibacter sp.]|jgi:hypothetical protein|nr:hypothetical protein [Flavisolibacter sp.]
MKNLKFFAYLLVVISTSLFTSCTRDNIDYGSTTKETITKSQWSVDYFFAGQDVTAQFSNYKINFAGNGTVTASDGTTSVNGTWSMITDLNRNEVLRINISENLMQRLNSEWAVKQTSDDVLTMKAAGSEIRLKKQ